METQLAKQKSFLTVAFGGTGRYTGKNMRAAHARMKLSEEYFDAVMENLGSTLKELNVPDNLIVEAAQIASSVKTIFLTDKLSFQATGYFKFQRVALVFPARVDKTPNPAIARI